MAVITCTHCGASGNAPDQILGQQVRCSKCKQSFVAGGGPSATPTSFSADEPDEPEIEDEGFPTNDDIARTSSRRSSLRDDEDDDFDDVPRRPIRKRGGGSSGFVDLLMFRRMVAPYLIMIVFWVGTALTIVGAFVVMGAGVTQGGAANVAGGVVGGLVLLVMGPLAVRLGCEVMIVIFRINETLTDIRNEIHKDK